jgi:hypothetical protein
MRWPLLPNGRCMLRNWSVDESVSFVFWGVVKWQDTGFWFLHSEVRILPPQPNNNSVMKRGVEERGQNAQ